MEICTADDLCPHLGSPSTGKYIETTLRHYSRLYTQQQQRRPGYQNEFTSVNTKSNCLPFECLVGWDGLEGDLPRGYDSGI